MHLLKLYNKKEEQEEHWISKEEAADIFDQMSRKINVISVPRIGVYVSLHEIKSFGVPKYIKEIKDQGLEVRLTKQSGTPYVQLEDGYLKIEEGKWSEKIITPMKVEGQSLEEIIESIKRIN